MSDRNHWLKPLDLVFEELRDAQHHIKHHKLDKANLDLANALSYLSRFIISHSSCCHTRCCNHCYSCNPQACCCHEHPSTEKLIIASKNFFSKVKYGTKFGTDLILPSKNFFDDHGLQVEKLPSNFYYYNLFINGMIQENGIVSLSPTLVVITNGAMLDDENPITLAYVLTTSP